jgi:hypothetical protein
MATTTEPQGEVLDEPWRPWTPDGDEAAPGSMEDFEARVLARLQREAAAADRRLAKARARLMRVMTAGGAPKPWVLTTEDGDETRHDQPHNLRAHVWTYEVNGSAWTSHAGTELGTLCDDGRAVLPPEAAAAWRAAGGVVVAGEVAP